MRQVRAEGPRLWLEFGREGVAAHDLVAWLGARYRLHDVTFQEPEIEDVIRRIYEEGLLLAHESDPPAEHQLDVAETIKGGPG